MEHSHIILLYKKNKRMEVFKLKYNKPMCLLSFFCLFLFPLPTYANKSASQKIEESGVETQIPQPADDNEEIEENLNTTNERMYSTTKGLASIPEGGIIVNGLFDNPVGGTGFNIQSYPPNTSSNNGFPYSEVTIGGKNNWVAMWSLDNNKLDFSKSFKGRMFVNFGSVQSDGFTFTIHNDSKKTQALTTSQDKKTDGQNLGVYGSNVSSQGLFTTYYPNTGAIKNSFSVEFDLYTNGIARYPSAFDISDSGGEFDSPHMAYTFPGNLDLTYQAIDKSVLGNISDANSWFTAGLIGRTARIKHRMLSNINSTLKTNVRDNSWYEFNFSFDYDKKEFAYFLRDPNTDISTSPVLVPWNLLSSELKLSATNTTAYWGFTAANGASSGNVKVVFADAPVPLSYDLKNEVTNKNGEELALENNGGNTNVYVTKGDQVSFKTTATIQDLAYTSTTTTYQVGLSAAQFDLASIGTVQGKINGQVVGSCTPSIDTTTNKFYITIPGNIKKGDAVELAFSAKSNLTLKADEIATFSSSLYLTNTSTGNQDFLSSMPVHFLLKYVSDPFNVSWTSDSLTTTITKEIDQGALKETGYPLTFYYSGGTAASTINYKVLKNGELVLDDTILNDSNTMTQKSKELLIPKGALTYGENLLDIVIYEEANAANVNQLSATIKVTGVLQLTKVPSILSWTNLKIGETKGVVARDAGNAIDLTVSDSRQNQMNDWYVSISTTAKDSSVLSDSSFLWQTKEGERQPIPDKQSGNTLNIMDPTKASLKDTYYYQLHLENTAGVLLNNKKYLAIGTYNNDRAIQWTLNQVYTPK